MSSHQQQLSALFAAASRGTLSSVRLVLEHGEEGVTEASADASGDTVLHVAARHERWDVCSWLISRGADAEARNDSGRRPDECVPTEHGREVFGAILAGAPSGRGAAPPAPR